MATQIDDKEDELDISSLIDVVFLLIMFFVVTADLDRESYDERVKLAECKFLKPEKKAIPKSIVVNILSDGTYTINRVIMSLDKIKNSLQAASKRHGDSLAVIIRLDRDGTYLYTDKISKLVQELKISKIRLVSEKK